MLRRIFLLVVVIVVMAVIGAVQRLRLTGRTSDSARSLGPFALRPPSRATKGASDTRPGFYDPGPLFMP